MASNRKYVIRQKISFKQMGSEILTNLNITLVLEDGFYHYNLSLKLIKK